MGMNIHSSHFIKYSPPSGIFASYPLYPLDMQRGVTLWGEVGAWRITPVSK